MCAIAALVFTFKTRFLQPSSDLARFWVLSPIFPAALQLMRNHAERDTLPGLDAFVR
jgi:hypothetical protein